MWITQWLFSHNQPKEAAMTEVKDIFTDDLVKKALKSDEVTTKVKAYLDTQVDAAVYTALVDILGKILTLELNKQHGLRWQIS
ncbi:DUF826 domain-containing protein [Pantoea agglomerans]|uniref:DUF826 domain-containing protein n=1 Tax=Enterobacter agglomerans TaxID=549 RepID=UPI003965AA3C